MSSSRHRERHPDSALDSYLSSVLDRDGVPGITIGREQLRRLVQIEPDRKFFGRLAAFAERIREFAAAGDQAQLIAEANDLKSFVEATEHSRRAALDQLEQRMGREIEQLASIDPLTGLWNRRGFDRQIESRINGKQSFCILLFDLNQFGGVNDRHGHLCGDEVLKEVGARLRKQVRAGDLVCRWGGDEFVVILECDYPNAIARSTQIKAQLSEPYGLTLDGHEKRVHISVAVGVAEHLRGESGEQLFQRADSSMYQNKKNTQGAG